MAPRGRERVARPKKSAAARRRAMGRSVRVTLYRGDSVARVGGAIPKDHRGRTYAEFFLGNGLMARHADQGRRVDMRGRDFTDLVLEHIGYDRGEEEMRRALHSPLISFSESREASMGFANRSMKDLDACDIEDASHFLWRFEPELREWEEPGRYVFLYRANPCNCQKLSLEKLRRSLQPADDGDLWPLGKALGELIAQSYAAQDETTHLAIVFDALTFLKKADLGDRNARLVANALQRAERDKEWLVLPADRMPDDPNSLDARLQMNASLFADEWFRQTTRVKKAPQRGSAPITASRRRPSAAGGDQVAEVARLRGTGPCLRANWRRRVGLVAGLLPKLGAPRTLGDARSPLIADRGEQRQLDDAGEIGGHHRRDRAAAPLLEVIDRDRRHGRQ
jgi:hypothetical protein